MTFKIGFLLLFSTYTAATFAGFFGSDNDKVSLLYTKSGMAFQVKQFPLSLQNELDSLFRYDERTNKISKQYSEYILTSVDGSFDPEAIKTGVKTTLDTYLSPDEITSILQWLDSPVGQKITDLEKDATFSDLEGEMVSFKQKLKKFPASKRRIRLISKLYDATRIADSAVVTNMITELTVLLATNETQQQLGQAKIYAILKKLAQNKKQIEEQLKPYILDNLMLTFREASDIDLQEYVEFARSRIGIKYHRALLEALNTSLVESTLRYGKLVSKYKKGKFR